MDRTASIFNKYDFDLSGVDIMARVEAVLERNMAKNMQKAVYGRLLSFVDLTSLKSTDNDATIQDLVKKINEFDDRFEILPHPAAICVYPSFVGLVKSMLTEDLGIAAVVGGFPHSQTYSEVKVAEASLAVADGATEIDMVLPVGKFLNEQYEECFEEITELKSCARDGILKVILETGLIKDADKIKMASILAMAAGADFIKTSTGKDGSVASLEAVYAMCEAIRDFKKLSGVSVGLKVAGGVSESADAVKYYTLVEDMLGEEWLCPELFRIGASRLVNNLLSSIKGEEVKYF